MKIRHRIQENPDASGNAGATMYIRKIADNATIATLGSDADGWVEYQANGHLPPYYLHVAGVAGGDRFLRSDDVKGARPLSLMEIPVALRALGDGEGEALVMTNIYEWPPDQRRTAGVDHAFPG